MLCNTWKQVHTPTFTENKATTPQLKHFKLIYVSKLLRDRRIICKYDIEHITAIRDILKKFCNFNFQAIILYFSLKLKSHPQLLNIFNFFHSNECKQSILWIY